jgi:hypothetical protein
MRWRMMPSNCAFGIGLANKGSFPAPKLKDK